MIAEIIPFKTAADMRIEFSKPSVLLELPTGIIGDGWRLVPSVEPTKASDYRIVKVHKCMITSSLW